MQFDPDVKARLREVFRRRAPKSGQLVRILDGLFISPAESLRLQDILRMDEARNFLERARRAAPKRLEGHLLRVFSLVYTYRDSDEVVRAVFDVAASDAYNRVARTFFHPPASRLFYEQMEALIFHAACRDRDACMELLVCLNSDRFFFLRRLYAHADAETTFALGRVVVDLGLKDIYALEAFLDVVVREDFERFRSVYAKDLDPAACFRFVADYVTVRRGTGVLPPVLRAVSGPRVAARIKRGSVDVTLRRIGAILRRFCEVDDESVVPDFLRTYAARTGLTERYIFDTVLRLDRNRAVSLISFFVSDAFSAFFRRYQGDEEVRLFMVRNAVRCVVDFMPPRFRTRNFGKLLLSILLQGKLPRVALNRRAQFMTYFTEHNSSARLTHMVLEFVFYDFVYLTLLDLVDDDRLDQIGRYVSAAHRFFAESLEGGRRTDGTPIFTTAARTELYQTVMRRLADELWKPVGERFPRGAYWVQVARAVAEEAGQVDAVLAALEVIDEELLEPYAEHLLRVWQEAPELIADAARPNAFYALPFERAKPVILEYTLPLVGSLPIYPADWAKTEGRAVYLPRTVDFFLDDPEELSNNRNLTMYVYLALHECGHLLGGSFVVAFGPYSHTKRRPELLRLIFNFFEDYRIETYLEQEDLHPVIPELFDAGRRFFLDEDTPSQPIFVFLAAVTDAVHFDFERYNRDEGWRTTVDDLFASTLPTGPYRGIREFCTEIAAQCRAMDTKNPLSALKLADHVYEIVEGWIETEAEVMPDQAQSALTNILEGSGGEVLSDGDSQTDTTSNDSDQPAHEPAGRSAHPNGAYSGERTVTSKEELEELYEEADAHPERFVAPVEPVSPSTKLAEREQERSRREAQSLVDDMRHTAADYRAGVRQVDGMSEEDRRRIRDELLQQATPVPPDGDKEEVETEKQRKVLTVRSYDPSTHRRLRRSEIREFSVATVDRAFLRRHARYASITRHIHRMLERMFPNDAPTLLALNQEDGDLEMERVIDIIADYKNNIEQSILVAEEEERPTAEVVIGLDISGSTQQAVRLHNGAAGLIPGEGEDLIIDMEKHFALIFFDALQALSITPTVYAFNSVTGTNIYRPVSREAISGFIAADANRDGDFLRYVSDRLVASGADRRYFFHISDGQPSALNYEGQAALEDTIVAMREVVRTGTRLIYINVDPAENNYFDLFRQEARAAIRCIDAGRLPELVPQLVHQVAADLQ